MDCDKLSFQELLDCLANDFENAYDTENNAWNLEHNTDRGEANICHHNFGNNRILNESRIILE